MKAVLALTITRGISIVSLPALHLHSRIANRLCSSCAVLYTTGYYRCGRNRAAIRNRPAYYFSGDVIGFLNAALVITEGEVGIETTVMRLRARILRHWNICRTLSKGHPF